MRLRYSISDSELAKIKLRPSKRKLPRSIEWLRTSLFVIGILVFLALLLARYAPEKLGHLWQTITADKSMAATVPCNDRNPSALVPRRVAHKAGTADDYRISNIHKNKAEPLKNSRKNIEGLEEKSTLFEVTL